MALFDGLSRRRTMSEIPGVNGVMPQGKARPFLVQPPTAAPADMGKQARPRGMGGIFGAIGRAFGNDSDMSTPNAWDYLMLGPGARGIMQSDAREREMFNMRREQFHAQREDAKRQRELESQRQQVIEQFIMSLPISQQFRARMGAMMDPEGFARSLYGGGEWQGGAGYTNAWRARPDGSIELGGELPLRPRQSAGGGMSDDWEAF